jgi:hypothetical protein
MAFLHAGIAETWYHSNALAARVEALAKRRIGS